MSRGLGAGQNIVLNILARDGKLTAAELALAYYSDTGALMLSSVTPAQVSVMRRKLSTLKKRKLVRCGWKEGKVFWSLKPQKRDKRPALPGQQDMFGVPASLVRVPAEQLHQFARNSALRVLEGGSGQHGARDVALADAGQGVAEKQAAGQLVDADCRSDGAMRVAA